MEPVSLIFFGAAALVLVAAMIQSRGRGSSGGGMALPGGDTLGGGSGDDDVIGRAVDDFLAGAREALDDVLPPAALPGSDQWIVAQTLWGEARGEGRRGMEAVADVIRNRVLSGVTWWGRGWVGVARNPSQFSAWRTDDPNRAKMDGLTPADAAFAVALDVAASAISGTLPRVTNGATHYYNPAVVNPAWASSLTETARIGAHRFLA